MPDNQKDKNDSSNIKGNDKPGGGSQVPNPGGQQGRYIAGDGNNTVQAPQEPKKEER